MEAVEKMRGLGPQDFEKLKLLGKGGVGRVFLVRLKNTDKLFAMKVLSKKEMVQKNKMKRVMTEREILATADHPFIVPLYSCFTSADKLYFVMEYCAGGEFFRMLQSQPKKCLSEEHAKFYAVEVLLALEYLHVKGFIYRDLKPENILLHSSGHIKLSDFDLSKQTTVSSSVVRPPSGLFGSGNPKEPPKIQTKQLMEFNSFVGTEEYLAPEIINGTKHTGSVDWWTFGILLYEMLYGKPPYKGASQDETFTIILSKKVSFPEEPPTSKEAKDLIRKLLVPDPKKRLGATYDANEIKEHPFFKGVSFPLIRNMDPPFKPKLNFDISALKPMKDPDDDELTPKTPTSSKDLESRKSRDKFDEEFEFSGQGKKSIFASDVGTFSNNMSTGNINVPHQ